MDSNESKQQKYFSYDPENGCEFHDTPEQAMAHAETVLSECRDYADDGWPENMEWICWGKVKGRVVETERRPADAESEFAEIVEYGLRDEELAKEGGEACPG